VHRSLAKTKLPCASMELVLRSPEPIDSEKRCTDCGVCVDQWLLDTLRLQEFDGEKANVAHLDEYGICFECEVEYSAKAIIVRPLKEELQSDVTATFDRDVHVLGARGQIC
jgi:hypothetical protein